MMGNSYVWFFKLLTNICYAIGFLVGFAAGHELLIDVYPDYGIFIFLAWFFFMLELFYIIPFYPAFMHGDWTYTYISIPAFLIGIIISNTFVKKMH